MPLAQNLYGLSDFLFSCEVVTKQRPHTKQHKSTYKRYNLSTKHFISKGMMATTIQTKINLVTHLTQNSIYFIMIKCPIKIHVHMLIKLLRFKRLYERKIGEVKQK